jgi:hypothetical protein
VTVAVADQNCENCYFMRMMGFQFRTDPNLAPRCCFASPLEHIGIPWPVIELTDWCGEWKDKDEVPAP